MRTILLTAVFFVAAQCLAQPKVLPKQTPLPESWKEHTVGGFSMKFPAKPSQHKVKVPTYRTPIQVTYHKSVQTSGGNRIQLTVVEQTLPPEFRLQFSNHRDAAAGQFVGGFRNASRCTNFVSEEIDNEEKLVWNFKAKLGNNHTARGRIVVVGQRLYCLLAVGSAIDNNPLIDSWWKSFRRKAK